MFPNCGLASITATEAPKFLSAASSSGSYSLTENSGMIRGSESILVMRCWITSEKWAWMEAVPSSRVREARGMRKSGMVSGSGS